MLVERFQDSARVKAWRSADEFDHLLKLKGAKLRYNLFDAAIVEQQNSRDGRLDALGSGPSQASASDGYAAARMARQAFLATCLALPFIRA